MASIILGIILIVVEDRSFFFKQPRDLVDLNKSNSEHTDLHKTRLAKRDAVDLKSLIALLKSNWIKPCSTEQ